MTRINVGIDPKSLSSKHLIAEHREIKRIPNMVKSGKAKLENIPNQFTLGTGHVKFFYCRLGYLLERYNAIYAECICRGFNVQNYSEAWLNIDPKLMGSYKPKNKDIKIIKKRLWQKQKTSST